MVFFIDEGTVKRKSIHIDLKDSFLEQFGEASHIKEQDLDNWIANPDKLTRRVLFEKTPRKYGTMDDFLKKMIEDVR
jgi:hypothetical protein